MSLREGNTNVFERRFERGIVLLNATGVIDLGGTFYRLAVAGSTVWDGAAVTSETIPAWDARILVVDAPF
jgi:hypothetical protein